MYIYLGYNNNKINKNYNTRVWMRMSARLCRSAALRRAQQARKRVRIEGKLGRQMRLRATLQIAVSSS